MAGLFFTLFTFVAATVLYAAVQNHEHKKPFSAALWGESMAAGALSALAVAFLFIFWPRLSAHF